METKIGLVGFLSKILNAEFFMESLTWDSVAISREALLLFSAFLFGCRRTKEEVEENAEEEEVIGEEEEMWTSH